MGAKGVLVEAIDQETNTETREIPIPDYAKSAYIYVPALAECTLDVLQSIDDGDTWGERGGDLDGVALPRTTYTGGSATVEDILWVDVEGSTLLKLVSSVAQSEVSVRVQFKA